MDGIQDEELKSKKQQNIGTEEKKQIIENEIENSVGSKSASVQKYINIIYLKLSQYYQVNYLTSQNIRIGRYNYDVILKSKFLEKREDIVLEIKYIAKILNPGKLLDSVTRFLFAINHYENSQQRQVTPVFLFIINESIDFNQVVEERRKLALYSSNFRTDLRIISLKETEIQSIDPTKLITE